MSERDELRELCCLFLKQHGADNRKEYLFPYDKGKLILDDNESVKRSSSVNYITIR